MKLPFIDIHIVRGRNVVTDGQLKEAEETNDLRNRKVVVLMDKIEHLKKLLKDRQ